MRRNARFGCLLAALWLALAVTGASPQLHHFLHEDANAPEHVCVIEHISQGAFLFSPDVAVALRQSAMLSSLPELSSAILSSRDFRVALSRGPPSFPTTRTVAG